MKPVLLHGPGISNSRKKLIDLKQDFEANNIIIFEEGSSTPDIVVSLQSVSMFGEKRLIIAENPSDDLANCALSSVSCTLVLWFDHEVDSKKWPDFDMMFFPEEKEASMFPLLDSLGDRDKKAYLELEKRNRTSPNDTQYIMTMIFYLLRSLIYLPDKSPEFVKKKVARQKINFPQEKVVSLYKSILETDFKIKKGLMEPVQAEFLIISSFFNSFQH